MCVGLVSAEAFDICGQVGDLESCGGLPWRDLLEKLEDWSDLEPETRVDVLVPDVTDVLVSLSSVITEFLRCVVSVTRIGNLWNRTPFLSPRSMHTLGQPCKKRWGSKADEERCRPRHCKFRILRLKRSRGIPRWSSRFGVRVTERSLQERNSTWKKVIAWRWKLESWNLCWVRMIRVRISDESWKKQGTKKVARYLRPSLRWSERILGSE